MDLVACRRQRLVQLSRKLAGCRPVLFHGSRYPNRFLAPACCYSPHAGTLWFASAAHLKSRHIGPTCPETTMKDVEPCSSSTVAHWLRGIGSNRSTILFGI